VAEHLAVPDRCGAALSCSPAGAFRAAALREVRDCGYATTRDVPIRGVSAIAAPVFEHTGVMKLALTLIGPTGLIGLIGLEPGSTCVTQLVLFARTLSSDLGWVVAKGDDTFMRELPRLADARRAERPWAPASDCHIELWGSALCCRFGQLTLLRQERFTRY